MEPTISIPITFAVFENLCKFLDGSTVSEEVAAVASKAITAWIEQQSAPPPEESPALLGGYQWKHLFLPAGTKLRIVVKRKTFHASIKSHRQSATHGSTYGCCCQARSNGN